MMSGCCLAAAGLDCAEQDIMPLVCYALAICQQPDKRASGGGLDGLGFQNPELLLSAAHGHQPFA